jgi:hypothetical protein
VSTLNPKNSLYRTVSAKRAVLFAVAAWVLAVGAGFSVLLKYEQTPGKPAAAPVAWPTSAPVALASDKVNLLLFGHPQCTCTRASIAELERIVAKCQGRLKATVFLLQPSDEADDWSKTAIWRNAAAIPGVQVAADRDGATALQFGAAVSGQVLLFSARGDLLFSGGITGSRGHEGDNAGSDAVVAAAFGRAPWPAHTPVYGCSIFDPPPPPKTAL